MFMLYQRIHFAPNVGVLPILPAVNQQIIDYLCTEVLMAMGARDVTSELRLRSSLKEE